MTLNLCYCSGSVSFSVSWEVYSHPSPPLPSLHFRMQLRTMFEVSRLLPFLKWWQIRKWFTGLRLLPLAPGGARPLWTSMSWVGQLLIKGVSVGALRGKSTEASLCSTQNRTLLFLLPRWGFSPCWGFVTAVKGLTSSLEHISSCSHQRLRQWKPFCGQYTPPLPRHPSLHQLVPAGPDGLGVHCPASSSHCQH